MSWRVTIKHPDAEPIVMMRAERSSVEAHAAALHAYSLRTNRNLLRLASVLVERVDEGARDG